LLKIDPSTGHPIRHRAFRWPIDSIGVGNGYVYFVGSSSGTVYRVDPLSLKPINQAHFGAQATRIVVAPGFVALGTTQHGGTSLYLNPFSLETQIEDDTCCPPGWGDERWSNGWLWWSDWPTGSVYREHGAGATPQAIHVTKLLPQAGGPCLNSIDLGDGAVWVTTAASTGFTCNPHGT